MLTTITWNRDIRHGWEIPNRWKF